MFYKDKRGDGFHRYSCYVRGNEPLNGHYHYLDMVPKGRDEDGRGPFWVRRRDEYDQTSVFEGRTRVERNRALSRN